MQPLTPPTVKAMLADGGEIALIDVREEGVFAQGHLLLARSAPLSRLELGFARLVPRRATRIVLCDADDGLAERAGAILARAGYTHLLGDAKTRPEITARLERRVADLDPAFHRHCQRLAAQPIQFGGLA